MTYSNSMESTYSSGHITNSSSTKSSKTLMEIERLKQAREERRQKQAEDRKILEELNETDRANFIYHQLIDQFRCSFYDNLGKVGLFFFIFYFFFFFYFYFYF